MTLLSGRIWAAPWHWRRGIAPRLGLALLLTASPAAAAEAVSLELLLALDVSTSVNDPEFRQAREGMAAALQDPEVIDLILSRQGGVAVAVTLWGGFSTSDTPQPWRVLRSEEDVRRLAGALFAMPRPNLGHYTALGYAIRYAAREIENNGYEGVEKKIDVAGDGRNNAGPVPGPQSARALAAGITINGLVIGDAEAGLVDYYRNNVAVGPDSFVEYAAGFDDFAEAFRRKLKRELSPKLAEAMP